MSDLEQMFRLSEASAARTAQVNRLQGILNEIAHALAESFGDEVHRARQEELPAFVRRLAESAHRDAREGSAK